MERLSKKERELKDTDSSVVMGRGGAGGGEGIGRQWEKHNKNELLKKWNKSFSTLMQ